MLIAAVTIIFVLYKYASRNFNYWSQRNISGPQPKPFVGNLWRFVTFKSSWSSLLKDLYNSGEEPFVGFYTFDEPALLIRDPTIIKYILERDFSYFQDRLLHQPEHNKVFGNVLFAMKNPEWKTTRTKLTPTFSSSKIKELFHAVKEVCDEMVNYLESNGSELESIGMIKKFSTEVISRTFFGVRGECFEREDSAFLKYSKAMSGFSIRNGIIQSLYFFKGSWVNFFKLNFFAMEIQSFFTDVFWKCLRNVEGMETKPYNFITILEELRRKDPYFGE